MSLDRLCLHSIHTGFSIGHQLMKLRFGDSLLVPARNVLEKSLINNPELRPELKEIMKGICLGGCFDFAKQLLEGELTVQRLIEIAEVYRIGAKIDAVHLQISHNKTKRCLNWEIFVNDILSGMRADGRICEMESRVISTLFNEILERNVESKAKLIQQLKAFYSSPEIIEEFYPNKSSAVAEFVKKYPNIDFLEQMIDNAFKANNLQELYRALNLEGDLTEILFTLLEMSVTCLKKKWDFDDPVPKKRLGVWKERFSVAEQRTFALHNASLMANHGLSLSQLNGLPMANDADNLNKLNDVDDGVYYLRMSVSKAGHALLFFKIEGEHFLWDFNVGLISLGKENFMTNILKELKMYPGPKGEARSNHKLCIFRLTNAP